MASLKEKVIYTLDKASELFTKWLEESCDESEFFLIDSFFKSFNAQTQNGLVSMVNIFANYKTMLNRSTSNTRFILNRNTYGQKRFLCGIQGLNISICDSVS